jgi:transcriptional regulator with XRE-family HTH domain
MKANTSNPVALRLKAIRQQTGCTPAQMAARLGITPGAYNKYESGKNFPFRNTLKRLADDFNISMDWLFFHKGPMYYKDKGQREKELEEEVKKLTAELEVERKNLEKLAQKKAASPEVKELLDYMEQTPIFYHKIMLYFREYQAENPPAAKNR